MNIKGRDAIALCGRTWKEWELRAWTHHTRDGNTKQVMFHHPTKNSRFTLNQGEVSPKLWKLLFEAALDYKTVRVVINHGSNTGTIEVVD